MYGPRPPFLPTPSYMSPGQQAAWQAQQQAQQAAWQASQRFQQFQQSVQQRHQDALKYEWDRRQREKFPRTNYLQKTNYLNAGTIVSHPIYGLGTVVTTEPLLNRAKVKFWRYSVAVTVPQSDLRQYFFKTI